MEFTQEQKMYAEIVQKAWEDENFKKALVKNPVEAIEQFTGKKLNLPEGKTLVVRDQTAEDIVYFNIPAKEEVDTELNEDQLEAVAGGIRTFWDIIITPGFSKITVPPVYFDPNPILSEE